VLTAEALDKMSAVICAGRPQVTTVKFVEFSQRRSASLAPEPFA